MTYTLTLQTSRILTEEELEAYKRITPLPINWRELEKTGKTEVTDRTRAVITYVTLAVNR